MEDIKPPAKKPKPIKEDLPKTVPVKPDENLDSPIVIDDGIVEEQKKPEKTKKHWYNPKHYWHSLKTHWSSWSRKRKIITSVGAGLVIVGIIIFILLVPLAPAPTIPSANYAKKHPAPQTVASPLTGVQVNPLLAKRPVTGVMIENSIPARPQSGLQDAGVVFEAIAEAGITRFLALFQESTPQYIGPVRSLRPYFIDYAAPFEASITHVGGSPAALNEVTNGQFRNLDQFYNAAYFERVPSRPAPHNVYTSFDNLDKLNTSKGYTKSSFTSWPRKTGKKPTKATVTSLDFAISGPSYDVHYDYDAPSNSYLRSEGGAPHMDLVSANGTEDVQLKPKVVIALVVPLSQGALDASGAYYSNYITSGSGQVFVFQNGGVTKGTWTKNGTFGQLSFTNSQNQTLKLDAGQTWITLVSSASQVSYK